MHGLEPLILELRAESFSKLLSDFIPGEDVSTTEDDLGVLEAHLGCECGDIILVDLLDELGDVSFFDGAIGLLRED